MVLMHEYMNQCPFEKTLVSPTAAATYNFLRPKFVGTCLKSCADTVPKSDRSLLLPNLFQNYEKFNENTKPTDKPHTKLDVFGGNHTAPKVPQRRFDGALLKGPIGQVDPSGSSGTTWQGRVNLCVSSKPVLTAPIHMNHN